MTSRINIIGPQFERADGVVPCLVGQTTFSLLAEMTAPQREALGMLRWDEPDEHGNCLWLFPKEWFWSVPTGFFVESISGEKRAFLPGTADDDRRFGVLSFGIRAAAQ